jgi:gamma-glutamyltranspeptidase
MIAGMADRLCTQKTAAAYFLKAGTCQAKDEGTVLRNPDLAGTPRALASGGAQALWAPPLAVADIISGLQGIVFNGTRANGQPGTLARAPLLFVSCFRVLAAVCRS